MDDDNENFNIISWIGTDYEQRMCTDQIQMGKLDQYFRWINKKNISLSFELWIFNEIARD